MAIAADLVRHGGAGCGLVMYGEVRRGPARWGMAGAVIRNSLGEPFSERVNYAVIRGENSGHTTAIDAF